MRIKWIKLLKLLNVPTKLLIKTNYIKLIKLIVYANNQTIELPNQGFHGGSVANLLPKKT